MTWQLLRRLQIIDPEAAGDHPRPRNEEEERRLWHTIDEYYRSRSANRPTRPEVSNRRTPRQVAHGNARVLEERAPSPSNSEVGPPSPGTISS